MIGYVAIGLVGFVVGVIATVSVISLALAVADDRERESLERNLGRLEDRR